MTTHLGSNRYVGPLATPDATSESLLLHIDPATGSDLTADYRLNRQLDFTNHGPFASFKGALNALPEYILHEVTLSHAAGTYTVDGSYFTGLERLHAAYSGSIVFTGDDGQVRAAGTTLMNVSSWDPATGVVTLSEDPGLTANEFRSYYLRIASGLGVGELKAIRSHSGSTFAVSARFYAIDATSVVEIVSPATTLNTTYATLVGSGKHWGGLGYQWESYVKFGDIHLHGCEFDVGDTSCVFNGTRLTNGWMFVENSLVDFSNIIIDSEGTYYQGLWLYGNSQLRCGDSESSWLVRNAYEGIVLGPDCRAFIYKGSVDDCGDSALTLMGGSQCYFYGSSTRSSGNNSFGIVLNPRVGQGSVTALIDLDEVSTYGGFTGLSGDILIDNIVKSYAQLEAAADRCLIGSAGSTLIGLKAR